MHGSFCSSLEAGGQRDSLRAETEMGLMFAVLIDSGSKYLPRRATFHSQNKGRTPWDLRVYA